ncbi:MAG: L-2-hydroxyglutarate oxidase [Pirellulales bacterium]|nr:L-2-hydroxyglutarate oxidase [Pirellulales bacterium]
MPQFDVAIVGGGIVGLATAMSLCESTRAKVVVLEAEAELAIHQTGHNSGVIHSGLYYKPGSHKARNCIAGRELMYRFCAEHGLPFDRCGKVVVATGNSELPALAELERRGRANGLTGMRRITPAELKEREPHATGVAALLVAETGIVDFKRVANQFAEIVARQGGEIRARAKVRKVAQLGGELAIEAGDDVVQARHLVNCAGLQADRIAHLCGADPGVRIIPFRGEYYDLAPERRDLVRHLIYPVADARFPFLGVHFTRRIGGGIEAGPNAVLALRREGYGRLSFSARDALALARFQGFWRMASRYWRTGCEELHRSWSKRAFVRALQKLVPELQAGDLAAGGCGVRAQAVTRDGSLVDDFHIVAADRMIHVLNAPSPAATASISIGREIADMAIRRFGLAAS